MWLRFVIATLITALLAVTHARPQLIGEGVWRTVTSACCLLDTLTATATFAVSTRKERSAYAGNAATVQRTSDSTSTNIGFSGTDLNVGALNTFCSGTTCNITTWNDQSTNVTNATSGSGVQVVNAGTNNTQNGHVWAVGVSGSTTINYTPTTTAQPVSIAALVKFTSNSNATNRITDQNGGTRIFLGRDTTPTYTAFAGSTLTGGTADLNVHTLVGVFNNTSCIIWVDGSSVASGSCGTNGSGGAQALWNSGFTDANMSTFFIFGADIVANGDAAKIRTSWQSYWAAP